MLVSAFFLLLPLAAPSPLQGQENAPPSSAAIDALRKYPSRIAAFWDEVQRNGTPLIARIPGSPNCTVTFVWRGTEETTSASVVTLANVQLASPSYQRQTWLEHLPSTDLWFRTYTMRCDARFTYKIGQNLPGATLGQLSPEDRLQVANRLLPDPLNKRGTSDTAMGTSSIVELPDAPPQAEIKRRSGIPRGQLESLTVESRHLRNRRTIWIYTPPGYSNHGPKYPVAYVLDGETRHDDDEHGFPLPTILDNLIAQRRLPPIVAVLVENAPGARLRELNCSDAFLEFLADELVPTIRAKYRTSSKPEEALIAGASLGALAAGCMGLRHSGLFGNVVAQSGAFANSWRQMRPDLALPQQPRSGELFAEGFPEAEWLASQFAVSKRLSLHFYLEVGLMEDVRWESPLPFYAGPTTTMASRHLRNVLLARGYDVQYHEYNGGHEALNWRGTIGEALVALLGTGKAPASHR